MNWIWAGLEATVVQLLSACLFVLTAINIAIFFAESTVWENALDYWHEGRDPGPDRIWESLDAWWDCLYENLARQRKSAKCRSRVAK